MNYVSLLISLRRLTNESRSTCDQGAPIGVRHDILRVLRVLAVTFDLISATSKIVITVAQSA